MSYCAIENLFLLAYRGKIKLPCNFSLQSYGATYVAQNFLDAKSSARKQFLQVFSRRIAESLETELHEDCTCKLVDGINPFSECTVTKRKEREPLSVSIIYPLALCLFLVIPVL
jgi:hypothetical protein